VASSLTDLACAVLATPAPDGKVSATAAAAAAWRRGQCAGVGRCRPPDRPARAARPELRPPREMPRRGTGTRHGRIALLHALAHIELNAIDLAWDLIARFAGDGWPPAFFDDWVEVAADEARHFSLLRRRLNALEADYGSLPAHDGLWLAALQTREDPLARLAVVPMALEARGLDVTPATIAGLQRAGDEASAAILDIIYRDEIGHVDAGRRWFEHLCERRGLDSRTTWRGLLERHAKGLVKPPFNDPARAAAGLDRGYYASA